MTHAPVPEKGLIRARAATGPVPLDSTNRHAVPLRIHHAKRPGTRARRIAQSVAMLARGDKVHGKAP